MMPQNQNPGDRKYYCCFGIGHVLKGALFVGCFQLILLVLVFIATVTLAILGKEDTAGALFGFQHEMYDKEGHRFTIVIVAVIIAIILQLVITILLIVGATKQKRYMLLPYLIVTGLTIVTLVFRFFGSLVLDTMTAVVSMSSTGNVLLLQIWFFLVVLRCFQYLTEINRNAVTYTAGQVTVQYPQAQSQPLYPQAQPQPQYPQVQPQPQYPQDKTEP